MQFTPHVDSTLSATLAQRFSQGVRPAVVTQGIPMPTLRPRVTTTAGGLEPRAQTQVRIVPRGSGAQGPLHTIHRYCRMNLFRAQLVRCADVSCHSATWIYS
jgi:hypothetical protein